MTSAYQIRRCVYTLSTDRIVRGITPNAGRINTIVEKSTCDPEASASFTCPPSFCFNFAPIFVSLFTLRFALQKEEERRRAVETEARKAGGNAVVFAPPPAPSVAAASPLVVQQAGLGVGGVRVAEVKRKRGLDGHDEVELSRPSLTITILPYFPCAPEMNSLLYVVKINPAFINAIADGDAPVGLSRRTEIF